MDEKGVGKEHNDPGKSMTVGGGGEDIESVGHPKHAKEVTLRGRELPLLLYS